MTIVFVLIGTILGLLVAGAIAKVFPNHDLLYAQAGLVAIGFLVGLWFEFSSPQERGPPQ